MFKTKLSLKLPTSVLHKLSSVHEERFLLLKSRLTRTVPPTHLWQARQHSPRPSLAAKVFSVVYSSFVT